MVSGPEGSRYPEAGHQEIRHEKAQITRIWAFLIYPNGHNLVTNFLELNSASKNL